VLLLAMLLPLSAANIRLYLTDGGDLLVNEYQVLEDRVRYYSVERSEWEEIPLALVDLEKTRRIEQQQQATREERAAEDRIERTAERKARTELHRVPIDDGVYYLDGEQVVTVKQAELKTETSKGRTLLKVLAPVPMAGKQTIEV
jgi:chaperonin cofactor prefoldin